MNEKGCARMTALSLRIAYYRKLKGKSAAELAEAIGITEGYVWQMEAPNVFKYPSLKTLYLISDFLEIPITKLLEE